MNEKKFRKSPIAIACYVISALLLVYVIYIIGTTVSYLNGYFAQFGMTVAGNFKEALGYILSSTIQPFSFTVLVFMAGYILDTVRKQDDANYCTDEELAARKLAKAQAKEAAKAAKAEAKAEEAAADAEVEDANVVADAEVVESSAAANDEVEAVSEVETVEVEAEPVETKPEA